MKQKLLIDIECYPEFFFLGCMDFKTKVKFSFEISESIDQRKELYQFLKSYSGFWVSFNGIHYDDVVLAFGQSNNWWIKENWYTACTYLKEMSDKIISDDDSNWETLKKYKWFKWGFTRIDLFLYWSKKLRLSKKISLKSLGIQMGYPVVQELPYAPHLILNEEQREDIKIYNLEHDLGILNLLTDKMNGEIEIRQTIVKKYKIDAWSMDMPKVASEILLQSYCKKTGNDLSETRKLRFDRPTIHIGKLLEGFNPKFETPKLQEIWKNLLNAIDSFDETFVLFNSLDQGVRISVGDGGIHSINNNELYCSTDTHSIITSDVASMYPSLIIKHELFRFSEVLDEYKSIKNLRLTETKPNLGIAKKNNDQVEIKKWKIIDTLYKFILNGPSGLLDMSHSWLYYPEGALKLRLIGQLTLLKLTEKCMQQNYRVVSLNTDGIEVIIPNDKLDYYYNVLIPELEQQFNLIFEHEKYEKIIYQNVNSYITISTGKSKKKGAFVTNPEKAVTTPPALGGSVDFLIIPKMLQCYFEKGIKPEFILNNLDTFEYNWDGEVEKLHIYDFCASQKCDRSYQVEWNLQKQQRLNRYFVSKSGAYLYKCKNGKKTHMMKGWGVQIYNKYEEKKLSEYLIDKRFYLSSANKSISHLDGNQTQIQN